MKKFILFLFGFLAFSTHLMAQVAQVAQDAHQPKGKILVILSSENKITLKEDLTHSTGVFFSELMVPLKVLMEAGYEPVFANPKGNTPAIDSISESAFWFGGDEKKYKEYRNLFQKLTGFKSPLKLETVLKQGLDEYAGLFVPGGHAPMEDLLINKELGQILKTFHQQQKPTALICHGPIALLSALPEASKFVQELKAGKNPKASTHWPYHGYRMTSFSTAEEKQEEPGQDNALGGFVFFYPDKALELAGGIVSVGPKWTTHVVRDRELITGQNPMSDELFAEALLQALQEKAGE